MRASWKLFATKRKEKKNLCLASCCRALAVAEAVCIFGSWTLVCFLLPTPPTIMGPSHSTKGRTWIVGLVKAPDNAEWVAAPAGQVDGCLLQDFLACRSTTLTTLGLTGWLWDKKEDEKDSGARGSMDGCRRRKVASRTEGMTAHGAPGRQKTGQGRTGHGRARYGVDETGPPPSRTVA
ncbi:hypothetical protein MAPG_07360 [Magnaporthiopsis poae ATCC 64411]|uniref:Uncharacterized protein n=1 Tax=Magnaporthiopsis poae (strain ATCC 64411 / 73-15) TaxID=644358 RepID=A0A0C4E4G6_MAGP6|nr:hypothetical protein MAPG_07360 [Magnaporthiopsis poae ATCC 64411]